MNYSVSNIAWQAEDDKEVYSYMREVGMTGLEIAPTRIFPNSPYDHLDEAGEWSSRIREEYGFAISSMQSIWYGRNENIFGSDEERQALIEYTKKTVDFAAVIGCRNLVFGCPRNRNVPEGAEPSVALDFFRILGEYAAESGTVIGMEANPPIYNTNFINDTVSALELIEQVDSKGLKLNLDMGTMIANNEDISVLRGKEHLINHVHISEPGLKPIEKRELHASLADLLSGSGYSGYVSIEVARQEDISRLKDMISYVISTIR